ncbi:MAG: aminoglycoside phosphotransferase family protein, partial [Bacillota bacterium]
MQIPEQFQQKMVRSFGERGSAWLAHLPHIYERAVRKWSLTNCSLSPEIFYNLICFGDSPDFGPVVLKIGMPHRELFTEIQALRLYGGRHICACHDADPELGALLLERVVPGTDLTHVASHRERSLVGAGLMARLPVPLAEGHGFPAYSALLQEAFRWVRAENRAGVAMLALVETAEALFREVEEEGGPAVLLHGDLHHKNILRDRQGGWRAIDPKGIAGVAVMETARFIQNE